MAIALPVTHTQISTTAWGIPITNEVNRLTALTVTSPLYFATTTARDALPSAQRTIGLVAIVGTPAGTTTAMPRIYIWDGSIWAPVDSWGATGRIGCTLTRTTQSIPSLAGTDITSYTRTFDPDSFYSGSGATVIVPAGLGGQYLVSINVQWSSSSLGPNVAVGVKVNGGTYAGAGGVSLYGVHEVSFIRTMGVGDTVAVAVYQDSGSAVNATVTINLYRKVP